MDELQIILCDRRNDDLEVEFVTVTGSWTRHKYRREFQSKSIVHH